VWWALVETFRHSRLAGLGRQPRLTTAGITPLADLRGPRTLLIFKARTPPANTRKLEIETRPCALDGSVGFVCLMAPWKLRLPMGSRHPDRECARVQDGSLQLQGG